MSVQVFKDGASEFVEPDALPGCIAAGWSVADPNAPPPQGVTILNKKPPGQPPYILSVR
jgi:hypothetical protein